MESNFVLNLEHMVKLEGKKLEMSQIFKEDGKVVPVTLVRIETEMDESVVGKEIRVTGWSKGAGFAGHMKRHGFHGTQATHGQSDRQRAPGASGSGTTPGRVLKGTRRAGRHGNKKVTLKGLKILAADSATRELKISGPLPGARNSRILIEIVES